MRPPRLIASPLVLLAAVSVPARAQVSPWDNPQWVTPAIEAPRVVQETFESELAGTAVSYHVFTPDEYDEDSSRRFPVLYWLHGSNSAPGPVAPLTAMLGVGMREGRIPPMIVVIPNGLELSFWVDSRDGSVPLESVMIEELIPHVDANYRTIASREGRIVEGFSMGGYGAARFGLKYPELIGAVSSLSGGPFQREFTSSPRASDAAREAALENVFGGAQALFTEQSPWALAESYAAGGRPSIRIRIVVGTDDPIIDVTRSFHAHLTDLGIPHEFIEISGVGHDTRPIIVGLGADYWAFFEPGS